MILGACCFVAGMMTCAGVCGLSRMVRDAYRRVHESGDYGLCDHAENCPVCSRMGRW